MFKRKIAVRDTPEQVLARIRAQVTRKKSVKEQLVLSKSRMFKFINGLGLLAAGTGVALAGNGFGQTALNLGSNLSDFGGLMQSGFYLSGFGLAGWGIHTMRKAHKEEGQGKAKMSHGALESLFGAALIAIPTFAGHAVNTMFSNSTNASENSTTAQVVNN